MHEVTDSESMASGRRRALLESGRMVAAFVPQCAQLLARIARDGRVPRRQRWLLVLLVPYLASPIDLVPDFLPVVGYLDDALIIVFVLRRLVRAAGADIVVEHWTGSAGGLDLVLRAAGAYNDDGPRGKAEAVD